MDTCRYCSRQKSISVIWVHSSGGGRIGTKYTKYAAARLLAHLPGGGHHTGVEVCYKRVRPSYDALTRRSSNLGSETTLQKTSEEHIPKSQIAVLAATEVWGPV